MKVEELFTLKAAKSKGNEDYDPGTIPFVTSSTMNNGVLKYVDPFEDDRTFEGKKICISGLGFPTVQLQEFLPKGNGGDSCTILTPREEMTVKELIYYAACFKLLHTWRFSFGRKGNKDRIKYLELTPFREYTNLFSDEFDEYVDSFRNKLNEFQNMVNEND